MTNTTIKRFIELRASLLTERRDLQSRLAAINRALGDADSGDTVSTPPPSRPAHVPVTAKPKRVMSAAWRAAQRRRWAKVRGAIKPAVPAAAKTKPTPTSRPTLREAILKLVAARQLSRNQIITGLKAGGFNPKSAGQYLYGKTSVVKNVGGKFGPK